METNSAYAADQLNEPTPGQMRFEDERVKMILTEFKLLSDLQALLGDCEQRLGVRRLTFESFHEIFPTFPILLGARCRSRVAEHCTPATLFRSFDDIFLMDLYLEVFARFQEEAFSRPIGLVVPFDGYRGGMIVHNGEYGTRGTRMVHDMPDDVPPHRVTVEPFGRFVKYLARGQWTPKSALPDELPTRLPQVARNMSITPWMVRRLGTCHALVVLAWLRKVLLSTSSYDRFFVRRISAGRRCVAATQEQIALETGLNERLVKEGIKRLVAEGLITPKRREGRTYIWLAPEAISADENAPGLS